jgi:P27 family predicted phage terminase small subunit
VEQHRADGTFRRDRHGDGVQIGGRGTPEKPPTLSEDASLLWDQGVPEMAESGILDRVDVWVLAQFFEAAALANASIAQLNGDPVEMAPTATGMQTRTNAAFRTWKDATAVMTRIASEFGMTPAARTKFSSLRVEGRNPLEHPDAPPSGRNLKAVP